jgi:hypothetical protein
LNGIVPNSGDLEPAVIDCTITSFQPQSELNLRAFDNVTILGSLLPMDLQRSEVEIAFTDS